jgi:hypothetical protein
MAYKFNPFTGTLDDVGSGGGGSTSPGGSDTQVQFNDGGAFGGDSGLTFNKTTNLLTVGASTGDGGQAKVFGDINLDDGGSFTTTVQCVTPTANRTISFPNATGTVALVAGSSGQLLWNQAGANAGVTGSVADSSGNVTLGGLTTLSGSPTANGTSSLIQSNVAVTGAWRTGASSNNPALLLNPTGTTPSTTWSASGTGIGVNAPASYAGNLLDLQVNGTSQVRVSAGGTLSASLLSLPGSGFINEIISFGNSNGIQHNNTSRWGAKAAGALAWTITNTVFTVGSSYDFGFGNSGADSTQDVTLKRDASGILAQRNGTNAQTFRVYNTFTSGTNYELGKLEWSSNVFRIGTEKGSGGGTARSLEFQTDGTTRLTIDSTGASAATATLVAGAAAGFTVVTPGNAAQFSSISAVVSGETFARIALGLDNGTPFFGFGPGSAVRDTFMFRDAANILAQRNGANAQTFRVYGTFTDASNHVRAALSSTSTAVTLAAETAGTGADNIPINLTAAGTGTVKVNSVAEVAVSSTVAGLPATPVVGMLTRVTDATSPTVGSTVAGGGAAAALVWYNGTNWTVIGV